MAAPLDVKRYDRQLRLWGLETQRGLQGARILVLGVNGLSNEICKNLVLAGVGTLHIQDSGTLASDDLETGGLFSVGTEIGTSRAHVLVDHLKAMNPTVELEAKHAEVSSFDADYLRSFTFIIGTARGVEAVQEVAACTAAIEGSASATDRTGVASAGAANEPPAKRRRGEGADADAPDSGRPALARSNGTHIVAPMRACADMAAPRSTRFLAAGCLGLDGFCFFDLGVVNAVIEPPPPIQSDESEQKDVVPLPAFTERALYPSISSAAAVDWAALTNRVPRLYYAMQLLLQLKESPSSGGEVADKEIQALLSADAPAKAVELLRGLLGRRAAMLDKTPAAAATLLTPQYMAQVAESVGHELAPVCAIVGGMVASEVIKIISGKERPINNVFFFDGSTSDGIFQRLGPSFDCPWGLDKGGFKKVDAQ
jgi:molybdopterin/thiamine biosynthesis adenylyltransferase